MSRIKSWILGGCAASSLFAVGASTPNHGTAEAGRFSVTITPITESGSPSARTAQGVPIVPFSLYHPEAVAYPRDAIASAGEAP